MEIKNYFIRLLGGLYLGLSLMSPFLYSTKMGLWLNNIDMVQRQLSESHHIVLTPLYLVLTPITYMFVNSSKHAIMGFLRNRLNFSEEDSKNEMDMISLIANLVAIILFVSVILSSTFLVGFNNELIKLTIVITILIIGLTINTYLDKKFRYTNLDNEFKFIHYILAVPIFILNTIALMAIII